MPDHPTTIFLIAGEVSGDLIGGRLMGALRQAGDFRFIGVGGETMAERGLVSLFPVSDLSLMGFSEVLPHLPKLLRRLKETADAIETERPAVVICIDAATFCQRLAKRLRKRGVEVPIVQIKAPSAWAYWPWRAKTLKRTVDRVLVILPFEPEFFAGYGVDARFIGHPSLEAGIERGDGAAFRQRHAIHADAPILLVLPGSRSGEVAKLLAVFRAALDIITKQIPGLTLVVPTVASVAKTVRDGTADWPWEVLVIEGNEDRYDAFAAASAAMAASGTVAVELAIAGVPTVIGYRMNGFTAFLARRYLTIKHVSIPNLVLDRPLIP
ncbi:MAG: lipid-A-disaccharide synthase, partial [Pseudomonadota bacterium]